ncbi:response regulator [Roseospira marina]|uniref:Response regulator n=1 Tax=Roseospira marina TaxID=140057 RepID=A0A5M6I7P2_9PROT|nr:response regulator [Roseospira marina]KAA5604246.1 response regulator [Roseospira marina]MBB4315607.1 CheY-like chemotaxis protein [Roseospira marina]MBB5088603.1 CheY-like chemotaxis protein [Roseospira marina]
MTSDVHARPTLLIVEDDPSTLRLLASVFEDSYDTYSATTGEEALAVARREHPDLIRLDRHLPDIAGWEVYRRVVADPDVE